MLLTHIFQNSDNLYYRNLEQKVHTTSKPQNYVWPNKNNHVGYRSVTEKWSGVGKIVHTFSTPYNSFPCKEEWDNFGNYGEYGSLRAELNAHPDDSPLFSTPGATSSEVPALQFPEKHRYHLPYMLGVDHIQEVYNSGDTLEQRTFSEYFCYDDDQDALEYFVSHVDQYNYPGSYANNFGYNLLQNVKPFGSKLGDLISFLTTLVQGSTNNTIVDHPFKRIERTYYYSDRILKPRNLRINRKVTYSYFQDGSESSTQEGYTYNNNDNTEPKTISIYRPSTDNIPKIVVENVFAYESDSDLSHFASAALTHLNSFNYSRPLISRTKYNGDLIKQDFPALNIVNNRIVPASNWTLYNGTLGLAGAFSDYNSDGKPQKYTLAKYGASIGGPSNLFFSPITLEWNDQLQLKSRTYEGFKTSYGYNEYFELGSVVDPDMITTLYTYDPRGRLETTSSLNDKQTITYTYSPPGDNFVQTRLAFSDGKHPDQITTQHIDGFGRPLKLVRENDGTSDLTKYYMTIFSVQLALTQSVKDIVLLHTMHLHWYAKLQ